jgi:hypothetical protein
MELWQRRLSPQNVPDVGLSWIDKEDAILQDSLHMLANGILGWYSFVSNFLVRSCGVITRGQPGRGRVAYIDLVCHTGDRVPGRSTWGSPTRNKHPWTLKGGKEARGLLSVPYRSPVVSIVPTCSPDGSKGLTAWIRAAPSVMSRSATTTFLVAFDGTTRNLAVTFPSFPFYKLCGSSLNALSLPRLTF